MVRPPCPSPAAPLPHVTASAWILEDPAMQSSCSCTSCRRKAGDSRKLAPAWAAAAHAAAKRPLEKRITQAQVSEGRPDGGGACEAGVREWAIAEFLWMVVPSCLLRRHGQQGDALLAFSDPCPSERLSRGAEERGFCLLDSHVTASSLHQQ